MLHGVVALAEVDERTSALLVGRFETTNPRGAAPETTAMRRLAEQIIHAVDRTVSLQAELWRTTIDEAHHRWSQLTNATQQQLESALAGALTTATRSHADALAESERRAAEQNREHWNQVQQALVQTSGALALQHQELARQGEVFAQVASATGDIVRLETELNRNLATLAGAQQLEEAMVSLSAAIQLLSVRVGGGKSDAPRVELKSRRGSSHAA